MTKYYKKCPLCGLKLWINKAEPINETYCINDDCMIVQVNWYWIASDKGEGEQYTKWLKDGKN